MSKPLLVTVAALLASAGLAAASASYAQTDEVSPWSAIGETTLTGAINTIEANTGGRVMEIRLRAGGEGPRYDAIVAKGSTIEHVSVGLGASDQVVQVNEREMPTWMAGWRLRSDQRSLRRAKVSLVSAIRAAREIGRGPAVDAGLASPLSADNNLLAYNIEIIHDGDPVRVAIDAETGAPIANPDSLLTAWTPEHSFRHAAGRG